MSVQHAVPGIKTEMSLGQLLGTVLLESGIGDLFCIPGDFTMQLSRELAGTPSLTLRTMSHEYGATLSAFAYAIGKARTPGAVCFTYGVGVLNASNAIAQAYVERVPLVVISGAPGKREREADIFLHHTIADNDSQYRIMRELTCAQVRIQNLDEALAQFRGAVQMAREQSRPVYIEIPRDLYTAKVTYLPQPKAAGGSVRGFYSQAWEAAQAVGALLCQAQRPVAVPGLEVRRHGLADSAQRIIERLCLPWVASPMSRNVLAVDHPNYRGVFAGPASPDRETRRLVETCDLLMLLGEPNSDVNMGVAGKVSGERLIQAHDGVVQVGGQHFKASTADFVLALEEACGSWPARPALAPHPSSARAIVAQTPDDEPLSPFGVIEALNEVFARSPDTVLVADCGDAFFMSLGMHARDVLASSVYMSMGVGVPGAIGYQVGSGSRPIALVGDGAFQMTGMELMHAGRFGVSPIVVVLNNQKWISLSSDKRDAALTDLAPLDFTKMADFVGVPAHRATTAGEFRRCLADAMSKDEPVLIDAVVSGRPRSYLCEQFFDGIKSQYHLAPPAWSSPALATPLVS